MTNPKFQIFQTKQSHQYYCRLCSINGEIILVSEGYDSKQSCQSGILAVKANALIPDRYKRSNAAINYLFNLEAPNGEIIGRSESYITAAKRESGIRAVMLDAPRASTEDLT